MSETEYERFDMETVEYDKDGMPVIPRINFLIPKEYRKDFLQMMVDEVRSTPGELLKSIFVRFMRDYRMKLMNAETTAQLAGERRTIPVYGPKPSKSVPVHNATQSEGA